MVQALYLKEYSLLTPQEKKAYYYKRLFKDRQSGWDDSLVLLTKIFKRYLKNKSVKVLDAGCGNGNWVVDELSGSGRIRKTVGVDISKKAISKNTSLDSIVIADLHQLPFRRNSFDAALSLWSLEHSSDPEKVLQEINRVLKPGGYIAFVTPNKHFVLIRIKRFIDRLNHKSSKRLVTKLYGRQERDIFTTYYRANDVSEVRKLAKKNGFKVKVLRENFDPSYTSFNRFTYWLTLMASKIETSLFRPHLVGLLQKA